MLLALLRNHWRPYSRPIALVLVLQLVQTLATLSLPALNAEIIDQDVIPGDIGLILHTGGVMIAITLVQVACAIGAVYFGAQAAMSLGRDVRASIFDRVQSFSAPEVDQFGAPSLITRTTNDVRAFVREDHEPATVMLVIKLTARTPRLYAAQFGAAIEV